MQVRNFPLCVGSEGEKDAHCVWVLKVRNFPLCVGSDGEKDAPCVGSEGERPQHSSFPATHLGYLLNYRVLARQRGNAEPSFSW